MLSARYALLLAPVLLVAPLLHAKNNESAISDQIDKLRSLPEASRPAAAIKIATDINAQPASPDKVKLADSLSHLVTEGDQGAGTIQAVADSLSKALAESPVPAKGDVPPVAYLDLAKLAHYERVSVTLADPLYAKALKTWEDNDASISDMDKADFTLKDINGKKVTLSDLKGKIVMVNFWATWCPPCRQEMPSLDMLETRFKDQGLVVLSITNEPLFKVGGFLQANKYHPAVLLDHDSEVGKKFHVDGVPRTFLFNRDGKLISVAIDACTVRQFVSMLTKTNLHP